MVLKLQAKLFVNEEVLFCRFSFNRILIILSLTVLSFSHFPKYSYYGQQQQAPERKKNRRKTKVKKGALVCLPHTLIPLCVDLLGDRVGRRAKEQHSYNLR